MSNNFVEECYKCSHYQVCANKDRRKQLETQMNETVRKLDFVAGNIIIPEIPTGNPLSQVRAHLTTEYGLDVNVRCRHFRPKEEVPRCLDSE